MTAPAEVIRERFTDADTETLARLLHLRDLFPRHLRPSVIFTPCGHITLDWNRQRCAKGWVLESYLTPDIAAERLTAELEAQAPREATAARFCQVGDIQRIRARDLITVTTQGGPKDYDRPSIHLSERAEIVTIERVSIVRRPFQFSV